MYWMNTDPVDFFILVWFFWKENVNDELGASRLSVAIN